jgi:uncharacterized protein
MDEQIEEGLRKGIREFNDEAFFEAHDTLEDVWMDVRGDERLFFQGLIQLSIGYYHLTCENFTGADHLLTRGLQKLKKYPSLTCNVHLDPLLEQTGRTLEGVRQTLAGHPLSFWTFPKIASEGLPVDSVGKGG